MSWSVAGNRNRFAQLALAGALVLVAGPSPAVQTDPARSSVDIVFTQMATRTPAHFRKFDARVDYDPTHPEAARASVDIAIASFDVGDAEYNQVALQKDWFDAAHFPTASFRSNAVKTASPGVLTVSGTLSIKGHALPVSLPVSVKEEGGARVFTGSLPIHRLAYGIGEGEWKDTAVVADEVVINFRIATRP